jgi:hypothetical protein
MCIYLYGPLGLRELRTREIGAREKQEKLLFSPAWSRVEIQMRE